MILFYFTLILMLIPFRRVRIAIYSGDEVWSCSIVTLLIPLITLVLMSSILNLMLQFFDAIWSTYSRWRRVAPFNQAINYSVGHLVGSGKNFPLYKTYLGKDYDFLLNLIRLVCGDTVNRVSARYSNSIYANAIVDFTNSLKKEHYTQCVESLELLESKFGLTEWIYLRMRECLIASKKFRKLQSLNYRAPKEYKKYLSEYGDQEWLALDMLSQYEILDDNSNKIRVLMNIANNNALSYRLLLHLIELLQDQGRSPEASKLIVDNWGRFKSIELGKIWLNLNKCYSSQDRYKIVTSSFCDKNSIPTRFLVYQTAIELGNFDAAQNIINQTEDLKLQTLLQLQINELKGTGLDKIQLDFDLW